METTSLDLEEENARLQRQNGKLRLQLKALAQALPCTAPPSPAPQPTMCTEEERGRLIADLMQARAELKSLKEISFEEVKQALCEEKVLEVTQRDELAAERARRVAAENEADKWKLECVALKQQLACLLRSHVEKLELESEEEEEEEKEEDSAPEYSESIGCDLMLLRHAEAGQSGELTGVGKQQACAARVYIEAAAVDVIVAPPTQSCIETALLLADSLGKRSVTVDFLLLPILSEQNSDNILSPEDVQYRCSEMALQSIFLNKDEGPQWPESIGRGRLRLVTALNGWAHAPGMCLVVGSHDALQVTVAKGMDIDAEDVYCCPYLSHVGITVNRPPVPVSNSEAAGSQWRIHELSEDIKVLT